MSKVGIFFLGGFLIILFAYAFKNPFDLIYGIMNNTTTLSATESFAWRLMPYLLPVALWAILVSYVSGKLGIAGGD